jgi:hypothetical protein
MNRVRFFDRAAIRIAALVGGGLQELVDQVAVGAVDLHAVEAAFAQCDTGRTGVVGHDAGNLVDAQRARHRGRLEHGLAVAHQHRLGLGCDRRRRHRRAAAGLQLVVRHAADMPELHHDAAPGGVHRVGHAAPAAQLFGRVQPRHVGIALALVADRRGFGDEQPRARALRVVGDRQLGGHGVGRAVARQRRHHDAAGQVQRTGGDGLEQSAHDRHAPSQRVG